MSAEPAPKSEMSHLQEVTVLGVAKAALSVSFVIGESDPQRAVELLAWAAELGHPLAIHTYESFKDGQTA